MGTEKLQSLQLGFVTGAPESPYWEVESISSSAGRMIFPILRIGRGVSPLQMR